jgi:hypothetical protein
MTFAAEPWFGFDLNWYWHYLPKIVVRAYAKGRVLGVCSHQ